MQSSIDITKIASPVLVTGGTGYLASWIIKYLLDAGLEVHATARSPSPTTLSYFDKDNKSRSENLKIFAADLLIKDSFAEAMKHCRTVFHTASPFKLEADDPQREIVDPAIIGAKNVLETASHTPSVLKVIFTSSVVAMNHGVDDVEQFPKRGISELSWNVTSSLDSKPYHYSKTVAEKAAWDIFNAQQRWKLVVVNPGFIVGPGVALHPSATSFMLIRKLADGTFRNGAPDLPIGTIDVRDVALTHLAVAALPSASGRYIASKSALSLTDLGTLLKQKYGGSYLFPPDSLYNGIPWVADDSKTHNELGIEYRSLEPGLYEMFEQMIKDGYIADDLVSDKQD